MSNLLSDKLTIFVKNKPMKHLFTILFLFSFFLSFSQTTEQQIDAFGGTASGTNSYSVTISASTNTTPYDKQLIWAKFTNSNTAASTLKVNSQAAKDITLNGGALTSGAIRSSVWYGLKYNSTATAWQIVSDGSGGAPFISGYLNGGNSFGGNAIIGLNDAFDLGVETGGTTKLTVESGGDVGVGITNPTVKLHVGSGDVTFDNPDGVGTKLYFGGTNVANTIEVDTLASTTGIRYVAYFHTFEGKSDNGSADILSPGNKDLRIGSAASGIDGSALRLVAADAPGLGFIDGVKLVNSDETIFQTPALFLGGAQAAFPVGINMDYPHFPKAYLHLHGVGTASTTVSFRAES